MARKKITKVQRKKKTWFNLVAPAEFRNISMGETPAIDADKLVGRVVKVNMMILTKDMKKQNSSVSFKVKEVKGKDAFTELIKYEMSNIHMKRIVKRGKDKVDACFSVETKDNINVKVKPVLLTKNKVQKSVIYSLRKSVNEIISKEAKKKEYSAFVTSILNGSLQKELKRNLKKIYPLSVAEIRVFQKL